MKFFSLTLLATTFSAAVLAQTPVTDTMGRQDSTLIMSPVSGNTGTLRKAFNNEVKLNVFSLFLGNVSLQYERAFARRFSVGLGFRTGPERALPFASSAKNLFNDDTVAQKMIDGARISNYAFTPELRCYFGKGTMSGFYLGLFGRFGKFNLDVPFTINDASYATGSEDVLLKGAYSYGGGGFQMGAKFNVSPRVSIDWFFFGPMVSYGKVSLEANGDFSQLTSDGKGEIIEELGSSFGEVTVDNNRIYVTRNLPVPGIRTGLSVGFRF